jgi:hypothetical protein
MLLGWSMYDELNLFLPPLCNYVDLFLKMQYMFWLWNKKEDYMCCSEGKHFWGTQLLNKFFCNSRDKLVAPFADEMLVD